MKQLCFLTNMTSSEIAAWVQAIGSIVAIGIAIWLSRKQHNSSLELISVEHKNMQLAHAKSLSEIAKNCAIAVNHFASDMNSRENVFKIASTEKYFDHDELNQLVITTTTVPLFSLPEEFVTPARVLAANMRQFQQAVSIGIRDHRTMDADAFSDLFQVLSNLVREVEISHNEIARLVNSSVRA